MLDFLNVRHKPTMLITVIGILFSLPNATFSQGIWGLSFPKEVQNGHFFIQMPKDSDKFYLFGHDVQTMDTMDRSLTTMSSLLPDVLHKEGITGYTVPYRHMDIFTFSEQKWWMVHEGRIFKTTDAGNNWQEVLSLSPNTQLTESSYFTSIHFPSENVGYAVGTADKIFRTLDGGDTWEELQWSTKTTRYRRLSDVYFVTESVGFALGYQVVDIDTYRPFYYYTKDAGQTWAETTFPESDHHYVDIQIVQEETWYLSLTNNSFLAPHDKLFKSIDGGINWEEVKLPSAGSSGAIVMRDMHWFTPNEGMILGATELFGNPNHIYKTYDGGENWQQIKLDQGSMPFFIKIPNIVMGFNGDQGVIAGPTGNILYSGNRGETWQNLQKGYPDVYDMSSDSGNTYAALYGNTLLKYNATSWKELDVPHNSQYQKAAFNKVSNLGKDKVATIDVYGEIHYSQDGGGTWKGLFTSLEERVLDIQFINDKLAALVFSENSLLYFPDVENPQDVELIIDRTPLPAAIFDLFYIGDVVFVRVESFLFKKSNDTWEQVFENSAFIRSLLMDDKGNALMRFSDNSYHYSNDTAKIWQETTFSGEILDGIDFSISSIVGFGQLNDTTHYALVHGSPDISERFNTSLILSNDKGKSWELAGFASFSEPNELGRIAHVVDDKGNLWVGTANGAIYRWLLNKTITGLEDPIKNTFSVYPNPTKGKFKIGAPSEIEAYQLFNLQGQLMEGGHFEQGTELEVPDRGPVGLYILQLVTVNGTKKTIKILKE